MSRIGRMPVVIPAGVTVDVKDGNIVTVKGAKGELTRQFAPEMKITVQEVEKEIEFLLEREKKAGKLQHLRDAGELPVRGL